MTETSKKREVNTEELVLDVANQPDVPTEDDETVVPAVGDESDDETEESAPESSPEEAAEEAEPAALKPKAEPSKPEIADVPGESPREKALRLELTRVKRLMRHESVKRLADSEPKATPVKTGATERLQKLREHYTEDEIKNMEEAIDVLAEAKGYVKQGANYQQVVNDTVDDFLEQHPEYKPENDIEDLRWSRFQAILTSGIYDYANKTPKQLKAIFNRVNKDVAEELGDAVDAVAERRIAAQQQKIKSVSHAGGSRPVPNKSKKEIPQIFKGFDEADFE